MQTNLHTARLLASTIAGRTFAAGLTTVGFSPIDGFALHFFLVPVVYVVAFAPFGDVSRSVQLAEAYVNEAATPTFRGIFEAGERPA